MKYPFNHYYSDDVIRWVQYIYPRFDKKSTKTRQELDRIQQEIINNQDAAFAYFFAVDFNYKTYLMHKIILDTKNARYAVKFAQYVPNSDIPALQKIVVNDGNMDLIADFACWVKTADLLPLKKLILKSKNPKHYYHFIKKHKPINIKPYKEVLFKSKRPRYLFELAKYLTDPTEIKIIEDMIIDANSFLYIRMFAHHIPLANVDRLEQLVVDGNDDYEIEKFAHYVKRSRLKHFLIFR